MTVEERIKRVREMFNLEEGEEFRVTDRISNPYHFTKTQLVDKHECNRSEVLGAIIVNYNQIEKIPWKPKEGQYYWILDIAAINGVLCLQRTTLKTHDRILKYCETFKTMEEAIIERDKQEWWKEGGGNEEGFRNRRQADGPK